MFLHLGADVVVSLKHIIAIMDLRNTEEIPSTHEFLALEKSKGNVIDIAEGEAKSLILTDERIFLSPISSFTLKKRAGYLTSKVLLDFRD